MTSTTHGGKGSKQRPVDKKKFDSNWDNIFGRNNKACAYCKEKKKGIQSESVRVDK